MLQATAAYDQANMLCDRAAEWLAVDKVRGVRRCWDTVLAVTPVSSARLCFLTRRLYPRFAKQSSALLSFSFTLRYTHTSLSLSLSLSLSSLVM